MRINPLDGFALAAFKTEAARIGIPYQTLIGIVLHRYVNGELMDKKVIAAAKSLVGVLRLRAPEYRNANFFAALRSG